MKKDLAWRKHIYPVVLWSVQGGEGEVGNEDVTQPNPSHAEPPIKWLGCEKPLSSSHERPHGLRTVHNPLNKTCSVLAAKQLAFIFW